MSLKKKKKSGKSNEKPPNDLKQQDETFALNSFIITISFPREQFGTKISAGLSKADGNMWRTSFVVPTLLERENHKECVLG